MVIFLLSLVAGIILGAVSALLLRDQKFPRNRLTATATIVLALLGLASSWYGHIGIERGYTVKSWPTVEGVVVDGRIEGDRASHAVVIYEYTIEAQIYRDSAAIKSPSFGGRNRRHDVAIKTLAEYPNGTLLSVSYDPLVHTQSTIETSIFWAYYGSTGLGTVLLGLSTCLLLLMLFRRRGGPVS